MKNKTWNNAHTNEMRGVCFAFIAAATSCFDPPLRHLCHEMKFSKHVGHEIFRHAFLWTSRTRRHLLCAEITSSNSAEKNIPECIVENQTTSSTSLSVWCHRLPRECPPCETAKRDMFKVIESLQRNQWINIAWNQKSITEKKINMILKFWRAMVRQG